MRFSLIFSILLAVSLVSATQFGISLNPYSGKISYSAGETANITIELENNGAIPVSDAYAIVQLSSGGETGIPSQFVQQNLLSEGYARNINLLPGERKKYSSEIKIPSWAPAGKYRFIAYLKAGRKPLFGVSASFSGGISVPIDISNANGKSLEILRSETAIEGTLHGMPGSYAGPVGPTIDSSEAKGKITIQNLQSSDAPLKINLIVARWDDADLNAESKTYSYEMNAKANANTSIDYSFPRPEVPSAYAVKIEVRDKSSDELYSMYRLRLVVPGEGTRIKALASDSVSLLKGRQATVSYELLPPADGVSSFSGTTVLEIRDANGESLFSNSEKISIPVTSDILERSVSFTPPLSSAKYSVSLKVLDNTGKTADEYSVDYDSTSFSASVADASLEIASLTGDQLFLYISAKDALGNPAECDALLIASTANGAKRYNLLQRMVKDGEKPSYSLYTMGFANGTYDLELYCGNFAGSRASTAGSLISKKQFCLGGEECAKATPASSPSASATPSSIPTAEPALTPVPTIAPGQPDALVSFIILVLIAGAIIVAVYQMFFKKKGGF